MDYLTIRGIKRVNEALDPELLSPDELTIMVNMYLDGIGRSGIPKKRGAWRKFNTNSASDIIYGIHDTKDSAGTNLLLAGVDTKIKKSTDGTGSWSDVKTGLTADTIPRWANLANSQVMGTNGTDKPFLLSGAGFATATDLEIARPDVSGVSTLHGTGGSLTANKPYHWVMVYETSDGQRSAPSIPFTHYVSAAGANSNSTDGTHQEIKINGIPTPSDARIAKILFFRTKGIDGDYSNARTYYYAFYINVGTTTVLDNYADTFLDTADTFVFTDLPSKAKYPLIHQDRLFLANMTLQYKPYYEPIYAKAGTASGGYIAGGEFKGYSDFDYLGGLENESEYKWRVTWVDADGKESANYLETPTYTTSLGAVFGKYVDLVCLPLPGNIVYAPPIKKVKIYRTKADGSTFYLVEELDSEPGGSNIAGSYRDQTPDASLSTEYSTPTTTKGFPSSIVYSEVLQPSVFTLVNFIDVYPDDGDEITGLMDTPQGVVVFKKNSIRIILTNGSPFNWQVATICEGIGCDEPNSLIINGTRAFFSCKKRIYRFEGGQPVQIGETFKSSWGSVTTFNTSTYLNSRNWAVWGVLVSSTPYLYIYDEKIDCWYKFSITAVTSLKEKLHGSSAGTLLVGDGNYLIKYDETQAQDNEAASTADYSVNLQTKTITLDGITLFRVRRLLTTVKQYANSGPSSEILYGLINDRGVSKAMTVDSGASGMTDYLQITDGMSGSLKETPNVYLSLTGIGLDEFHSARIEYRVIRRGKNIAN